MPLNTTDQQQQLNYNAVEINSFAVDAGSMTCAIAYDLIYIDADNNKTQQAAKTLVIAGRRLQDAIATATGYCHGGDDIYTALKRALYDEITTETGITGTLS